MEEIRKNENGKRTEHRITKLETSFEWVKSEIGDIKNNHLAHLNEGIEEIKGVLHGRPSWVITLIISGLASISGILLTVLVTK